MTKRKYKLVSKPRGHSGNSGHDENSVKTHEVRGKENNKPGNSNGQDSSPIQTENDAVWADGEEFQNKKSKIQRSLPMLLLDISDGSTVAGTSESEGFQMLNSDCCESRTSDSEEEFSDGYDENFMGDEEDKARLIGMTERERELEIYNRFERREELKIRFEITKKLRLAKRREESKSQLREN